MTLNISTPLADKWDRVPEKYKKLVNEGKMTYQEAFKYAEEAPRTSSVQPKKSLDTTESTSVDYALDPKPEKYSSGSALVDSVSGTNKVKDSASDFSHLMDIRKYENPEVANAEIARLEAEDEDAGPFDQWISEDVAANKARINAIKNARDEMQKAGGFDKMLQSIAARQITGKQQVARAEKRFEEGSVPGTRLAADIINSRESAYGIPFAMAGTATVETTGPAGPVAGSAYGSQWAAKVAYDSAFQEASLAGADEEEARTYALAMMSSEFAAETVSGAATAGMGKLRGVVAKKAGTEAAKAVVLKTMPELAKKFAKMGAVNYIEEAGTTLAQDATQEILAKNGVGSEELRKLMSQQVEKNKDGSINWQAEALKANRSGMAGMGQAITIGGVHETFTRETSNQVKEHNAVLQEFDKQQKELEAKRTETQANNKVSEELKKQADAVAEGKAPVIQDLFTSEAIPAEQVAAKAEAALAQNTAEATNPETAPTIPRSPEQQMEVDNRIVDTLKKQEAGKAKEENKTVNTLVTEELAKREQIKQAEDIVKNKYDIVNVQDIAQEANQRMKAELDAIAQSPGNRTAEGQKLLPEILARREALRLPEIKEQVKNERLAKVEQAASFLKQEEEAQVRKEVETKVAKEQAASEPTQTTLPMKYPQQPQPKARGYTGTMTPEQKVSEAKDMAFKKELASLPPEQAKVLLEETQKAEKAAVAQEKKQEKAKTAAYMAAKSNARSSIAAEVSSSMPEADAKTKAQEIGRRMLEWNTKNPEEKFVLPEVRKATTVTQKIAAKEKAKETKVSRAVAGKEQKNAEEVYEGFKKEAEAAGLAPKEAHAQAFEKLIKHLETIDSNEALPKEAEATLRESLGQKNSVDTSNPSTSKASASPSTTKPLSAYNKQSRETVEQDFPGFAATLKEALTNGNEGLVEVLDYIGSSDIFPKSTAFLARRLLPLIKKLKTNFKDSKDSTAPESGSWRGYYDVDTDTVYIGDYTAETILHETLHAVVYHVVQGTGIFRFSPAAKRLVKQLRLLQDKLNTQVDENMSKFSPTQRKFIQDNRNSEDTHNMFEDIHELVTYAHTSPIAQRILSMLPSNIGDKVSKANNLLKEYIGSIREFLQIPADKPDSMLEEAIILGDELLTFAEDNIESIASERDFEVKQAASGNLKPNQRGELTLPITAAQRAYFLDGRYGEDITDFKNDEGLLWYQVPEPVVDGNSLIILDQDVETLKKFAKWLEDTNSPNRSRVPNGLLQGALSRMLPNKEVPSDKPRPVLERTGRVLTIKGRNNGIFTIKGRDIKILNHGTAENMLGVIQDALTSGHGFSANVTESLSVAQGLIGEYLQRAKARFDTIENSLKEVATKTKAPLTQVQEEFTKAVGTFEQAEGDAKTSISNSLVRNYGDAARAYFANRAEIDSLTDMIIQERLKNPEPFTSKEAAIYGKMKQELGKYYTRSYASNLKGVEETYAKSMIDAYNAKQKGTATEHQKVLAATMEAAIDTIHNTFVLIPDADVLANSSLDKLRTLAATWNLKVAENDDMSVEDKKDAFIEALDSFREDKQHLNSDFTGKRAVALATELLKDIEGSPIVSYLKGARADRTVVEARENIPPSIRKFLGEYEDVALKGLTTILKQAQFIFQTKALGEILTSEQDKGANSKILSVEEFTEKGYSTEDWKKATGESFGPLQGMYIEESLYNRLQELRDVNTPLTTFLQRDDVNPIIQAVVGSTVNGWMKSMSLIKQGQLVFNPVNAAYNLLGGPNILLSNGAFGKNGIKNVRKAMDTALSLIAAQGPTSVVHPEVSRMIRTNQVDSAYLGSLRGSEMDKVRDLLLAQLGETDPSLLTKGLRKGKERLTQTREIYAMMDVVWKIAAFYHRVDVLTEFDKLNGVERSPEAVDRQAAADNSLANFSYSHVPKFVKAIEKFGPSYILPFVTESFRAPFSSMLLGISDIKRAQHALTPEAKSYLTQQGAKRALGAFTAMTTAGMIMHAGLVGMSKLIGDDDEDKDQKLIEKLRPFMAPYEKFDDFFVAGKDSKGNPVLVNFNRTDPFDTVSRLTRMIAQDATADEYETYFKNLFITNKRAASLLDAVMSAGQENDGKVAKNTRMENFYRPDFIPKDWPSIYESLSSVAGPKTVKAIDGILPSWLARSMDSRNEVLAPNGTVSKALGVDVFSATVKYGGGQLTTVDINKSLKFAVIDYDKEKKAAAEQLKSILSTSEVLTKEEYHKAWVEATHQEKEAFNKLAEKFSGLQSLGYSGEEAAKYLEGAGMDKKVVHSLMQGTYRPENSLLISQASRDALKKDIEADTSPQMAKRARNYNASLEAIKEYNLPVRSK